MKHGEAEEVVRSESSDLPEVRMLLSLRTNEVEMRRRLASCEDICAMLFSLYRSARAAASAAVPDASASAPASAHSQCSLIRDFVDAFNQTLDLIQSDMFTEAPREGSLASMIHETLHKAVHDSAHGGVKAIRDLGISIEPDLHLVFAWRTSIERLQQHPEQAAPGLRRIASLAERIATEAHGLLDPLAGPIAEERANLFTATKRLRAQIEHIRGLVQRKCNTVEAELRSVQTAIIKAQSQTMALVKGLSGIGKVTPSGSSPERL